MTSTSRQSLLTLATDLNEVVAWGDAAEAANAGLQATIAAKDAEIATLTNAVAHANAAIAALNTGNAQLLSQIEQLEAELALYRPRFLWGDATRQQFLGNGFTEPFPFCYESELYPGDARGQINYDYVLNGTMPAWRSKYPNSPRWAADIEWQFSGGVTAAEVQQILPAFQAARAFATTEGKGLRLGAYNMPKRIGVDSTANEVEVLRPILDLLDESILPLYALYADVEKGRRYVQQNIAMVRAAMPGKSVYVIGWPAWHSNVGAPLAGTPISPEWWRMLLEESHALADGFAIWLKAAAPKPTDEPWWLETLAWRAAL